MNFIYSKQIGICLMVVILSCQNKHQPESVTNDGNQTNSTNQPTVASGKADTVSYRFIYGSSQAATPLSEIKNTVVYSLDFEPMFLTDPERVMGMPDEGRKAVMLGVLITDMVYATCHNSMSSVLKFSRTMPVVAGFLNLQPVINDTMLSTVNRNINTKDSILFLCDRLLLSSDSLFKNEKKELLATNLFLGVWLEAVYLYTSYYQKANEKELQNKLKQLVLNQKSHLPQLIKSFKKIKGNVEAEQTLIDLNKLNTALEKLNEPAKLNEDPLMPFVNLITEIHIRVTN